MIESRSILTNNVRLHTVQAGPTDGRLVILLHGFPEFWYGWRYQIDALAAAGFRVWVPDQRGYNLSDKPPGIDSYRIETLAEDILGLIEAGGSERAFIAGHDWGAAVAWHLGAYHPERVEKMAVLNVPHPDVMKHTVTNNLRQFVRSWYIFFFQIPWVAEVVLKSRGYAAMSRTLYATSRRGAFTTADLERYRQAWSQPGALQAMLNWYRMAFRQAFRERLNPSQPQLVQVPTLIIWGARDVALELDMARKSVSLCREGELVVFDQASHWIQYEEACQVNRLLIEFFQ